MNGEIIKRILDLLEIKGLKAIDLCHYAGIGQSTFANWKMRGSNPPAEHLTKIAKFLDVTIEYLLNGESSYAFDNESHDVVREETKPYIARSIDAKYELWKMIQRMDDADAELLHNIAFVLMRRKRI